ncbi:MAG: M6 family metalloprotease domain-containing protein [Microcystis sp.]|uniref:M6 family metalloprotease domain-containing protein n=1 Tax=unclassified Microcystis TaxID=2643300 RepID=UPI0022C90592|nr:M6 family metalloprotease domain-containing protein [Microcystis sp. LE19-195.1E]MCZ8248207.1 M6 family metalloprotease domain-containing protein [Microcystis sp. LE19-195.1E]
MPTPFVNEEFTFTNPDGSTIRVRGSGNQYYAVFETLDGYTVVKNPDNGFYTYAQLSEDKSQLIATDGIVGQVAPQSLGIQPHLSIETESAKQQAQSAPMLQEGFSQWRVRRQQKKTQLQGISATTSADARPASTVTVGNYLGLCILIKFPDVAASISQQEVSNFCNLPGYAGFGNKGSVRDYFYDNSQGKLTYTNVVTQYYTAAHNRSYYTDPAIDYGTRARELILEALNYLKSQGFNFSQLSSDSNGLIYALNVFYVGPRVNNWAEGLWPHSWSLASPYDVGGGKKLYDYQITNMGSELTLRTFCHENGHMICDFPDLYDYGGQSAGVGNYCLMCYGGNDKNPVQVCAYLKNEAGWASKVTAITPGLTASLPAAKNEFYLYSKNANEYFLIENRQKTGRDTFLPDAGLAIWHVDEQKNGNEEEQMTPSQHYECSLEQADNRFDLEKDVNAGDNADLFRASYKTEFSDSTSPAGKWWDGSNSGLKIAQISAVAATMTFTVPGSAWLEKKQITGLWMINQERNAAAYVDGLGWRKIASESDSVFLGMLTLLSAAKERKFPVNLRLENNVIQEIYVF